jgi:hypothetical protein
MLVHVGTISVGIPFPKRSIPIEYDGEAEKTGGKYDHEEDNKLSQRNSRKRWDSAAGLDFREVPDASRDMEMRRSERKKRYGGKRRNRILM